MEALNDPTLSIISTLPEWAQVLIASLYVVGIFAMAVIIMRLLPVLLRDLADSIAEAEANARAIHAAPKRERPRTTASGCHNGGKND